MTVPGGLFRLCSGTEIAIVSSRRAAAASSRPALPADIPLADVVYNGIPIERFPFREEKEDFLLFVGRANREKGWSGPTAVDRT